MEYNSTIKKIGILPSATKVDLKAIVPNEISQPDRQKPYDFTYMWNLKNKINEQEEQKETRR